MFYRFLWITLIYGALVKSATVKKEGKKDRVVDLPLSDAQPGTEEYDHEAFLGAEESKKAEDLSPEESKAILKKIVLKIDIDNDDKITLDEMKNWIENVRRRYHNREVEETLGSYDNNHNDEITWEEYYNNTYGHITENEFDNEKEQHGVDYRKMIARDQRRWKAADLTGDDILNRDEMGHFLFPEDFETMHQIVVQETFEDIDKNEDGGIDIDEFIGDMYQQEDDEDVPEWVGLERDQFKNVRDKNHDGKLNVEETYEWVFPKDYEHVTAEAQHLLSTSDDNRDGTLSMDEIINHYQTFVGSQITYYGQDLVRHDEF